MTSSWYDESISYGDKQLTVDRTHQKEDLRAGMYKMHPEYFNLFGLDLQFKSDDGIIHIISLHSNVWRCTCSHFQTTCGHIIAVQMLISSAFNQSLAPTIDKRIPHEVIRLAASRNVNPPVIYKILGNEPITRKQAIEVLDILSQLTGEKYSLETVDVTLPE